jgi:hypothetical protein
MRIETCECCGKKMRIGIDEDIIGTGWFSEKNEEMYVHIECLAAEMK